MSEETKNETANVTLTNEQFQELMKRLETAEKTAKDAQKAAKAKVAKADESEGKIDPGSPEYRKASTARLCEASKATASEVIKADA